MAQRRFKPVLEKAGIKDITFHELRHTYIYLLISENVSVKVIQNQAGHSTSKITMDTYAHLMECSLEQGANALDRIFSYPRVSTKGQ